MKLDKEYPATHSMATDWFGIDSEGNVALIEFEDNGAVPALVGEQGFQSLVWEEQPMRNPQTGMLEISLTPDQLEGLISCFEFTTELPEGHIWNGIWRIDTSYTALFLETIQSERIHYVVLSQEQGVYYVDNLWSEEHGATIERLRGAEYILGYAEAELEPTAGRGQARNSLAERYTSIPYYVYTQDYSDHLLYRLNLPEHCIQEGQMSQAWRARALRLPFSFAEARTIQIARHYPSGWLSGRHEVETEEHQGREYRPIDLAEGETAYVLTSSLLAEEYSETEVKQTLQRDDLLIWRADRTGCFSFTPTIAVIMGMKDTYISESLPSELVHHTLAVSYLPFTYELERGRCSDCPIPQKPLPDKVEVYRLFADYLERVLAHYRPHVLLLQSEALEVLGQCHHTEAGTIELFGVVYPFYRYEEAEERVAEILTLARQPYRGTTAPIILPQDDDRDTSH